MRHSNPIQTSKSYPDNLIEIKLIETNFTESVAGVESPEVSKSSRNLKIKYNIMFYPKLTDYFDWILAQG